MLYGIKNKLNSHLNGIYYVLLEIPLPSFLGCRTWVLSFSEF